MSAPTKALLGLLAGQQAAIHVKRLLVVLRLPRRMRNGTTKMDYVGLKAALMLDQLIFWSCKPGKVPGWVYKSYQDWWREIGLTRRESECATQRLREMGLIVTDNRHPPGYTYPVLHYQVQWEVLEQAIAQFTGPLDADEVDPDDEALNESPSPANPSTCEDETATPANSRFSPFVQGTSQNVESLTEDPFQKDLKKEEEQRSGQEKEPERAEGKQPCRHPPHERLPVPDQDMLVCLHCWNIITPSDLPPPPDTVTLHASVLWCASCQHATPVVEKDATYYCLHCGTPTGQKEGESP
jgi:hypothetical protein